MFYENFAYVTENVIYKNLSKKQQHKVRRLHKHNESKNFSLTHLNWLNYISQSTEISLQIERKETKTFQCRKKMYAKMKSRLIDVA